MRFLLLVVTFLLAACGNDALKANVNIGSIAPTFRLSVPMVAPRISRPPISASPWLFVFGLTGANIAKGK